MENVKKGLCHCGAVQFEVQLARSIPGGGLDNPRRCNCSLCRRKGAIIASVPLDKLRVTSGKENLSLYQWNSKTAEQYFCRTCGIYSGQAQLWCLKSRQRKRPGKI